MTSFNRISLSAFAAIAIPAAVLFNGTAIAQAPPPGAVTTDKDNTLSADRAVLQCPVQQATAENGARPDPELLRKLVQCKKGEKAAEKGYDGAVTIDVADLKIGTPRPWSYRQDIGSGQESTKVFPVKVTYTEKTHYRTRTEVSENWVRVMNFYVNSFGEWQSGSEESIKAGDLKSIPRTQ